MISSNEWSVAIVKDITIESATVKTYVLEIPHLIKHLAGQHYELRLTSETGYQAARPYSAASTSSGSNILELTIQRISDGEVTPYLYDILAIDDQVEVRGPFGKFFVWDATDTSPVVLIGGGTGVIPMHAMLRAYEGSKSKVGMHLLYSAKTFDDILYKKDFLHSPLVTISLTRDQPKDWSGAAGRISLDLVKETLTTFPSNPLFYICGMNGFVNTMTDILEDLRIPVASIKTERFG